MVTAAAVGSFALYELVKTLLYPGMSVVASHIITVFVVGTITFFVSRYALTRYSAALKEIERQTEMTEETNRLLSAVLATMREGVVIVNSQMHVVLYNNAAARIVKLPDPTADPATIREDDKTNGRAGNGRAGNGRADNGDATPLPSVPGFFNSHLDATQHYRLVDATRDPAINDAFRRSLEERKQVETRIEMTGIESRSFQLNVAPLGRELAVGVFFDITQLERLERVRREFFANLSHELRTPLTAILAYAETLLTGAIDDPENNSRFVKKLYKHAARMSELISDISDLSAIESGQVKLSLGPVRLRSVVTDVIALAEARRGDCDARFEVDVPDDLLVEADRTRTEQILYNLIDNAVKFNRPGGTVRVEAKAGAGFAVIHITDTGVGIAAADLPRVFERLYRADKSRSRKIEGTGLGLAIVKHLVQAHGGEVFATSEVGRGSQFGFTLPLPVAPELTSTQSHL